MGYIPPPGPTHKEKEMLIVGIIIGAMFSFLGSYIVTATFRLYDYGYTVENIMFLVFPLIVFIFILRSIPKIIKKL